jgi:hypothetical protein
VSFVLYAFRSTGEPGLFDRVIYWGNLIARRCSRRCSCTSP